MKMAAILDAILGRQLGLEYLKGLEPLNNHFTRFLAPNNLCLDTFGIFVTCVIMILWQNRNMAAILDAILV